MISTHRGRNVGLIFVPTWLPFRINKSISYFRAPFQRDPRPFSGAYRIIIKNPLARTIDGDLSIFRPLFPLVSFPLTDVAQNFKLTRNEIHI